MIHIGLFEGIGGFSLAAHGMGWKTYATCEINPFGQQVLKHYWPNAYHHGDIHTLNYETINTELSNRFGTNWRNEDIIITGGFPCQPYSLAGKRLGKEDSRHLWPEMLRVIREVQPTWVLGENVFGIINWSDGLVFHEVQTDLEAEGYEVQPYVLPACAVNAPHRRDRVWFVAKNTMYGRFIQRESEQERTEIRKQRNVCTRDSDWVCLSERAASDTESQRLSSLNRSESEILSASSEQVLYGRSCYWFDKPGTWKNFPTQSQICSRNDGVSSNLVGITVSKHRNESIKAYGNAIVPQVAYQIFKAIQQYENL